MKKIYIYRNDYPSSEEIAKELKERFDAISIEAELILLNGEMPSSSKEDSIHIVVGGDGTFLQVVRDTNFSDVPIIGVNTGHLGFFQEVTMHELPELVHFLKKGDYTIEPLRLLDAKVERSDGSEESFLCVNEILVKGVNSKVIHLDVLIEDVFLEKFSGDGLIVSTSIGSTAYNFSVGGAVVHPHLETIQISPLAPISSASYRSLLNPIVMPGNMKVRIVPETTYEKNIFVVQDGKEHEIKNISAVHVSLSDKHIQRIHIRKDMYWKNLRDKFI
ncbi:MAG: NAD(+)/NADH kinase [Tissierellia bacterium]|nr:NAD(+)/NADH kinase [Tissierellia bacterium]